MRRLENKEKGIKALVEYLVKALADHPEKVELEEREEDDIVLIALKISPDDIGKIIGKNGNTINAIRTVLQTAASSHRKRAKLEVAGQGEIAPTEDIEE